jgi:UDP-glucose 4-epimerase
MTETILVTGGAGYVGSHACVELLQAGHRVVVLDNLSNSKEAALDRVRLIAGKPLDFVRCDLLDRPALDELFNRHPVDAVLHFAGLKAVGESVAQPLRYYRNNVCGTANLLEAMAEANVKDIVFSSSCTVYGAPKSLPIREDFPLQAVNP